MEYTKIKRIKQTSKNRKNYLRFDTCFNLIKTDNNTSEQLFHKAKVKTIGGIDVNINSISKCDENIKKIYEKCCQRWTLSTVPILFNITTYKSTIFIKAIEKNSKLKSKFNILLDLFDDSGLFKKNEKLISSLDTNQKEKMSMIIDGGSFSDKNMTTPLKSFSTTRNYFLLTAHEGKCCDPNVLTFKKNPIYKWGDCPMKNSTRELGLSKVFLNVLRYDADLNKKVVERILLLDLSNGNKFYGCPSGSKYEDCSQIEYYSDSNGECKTQIRFSFILKSYHVDGLIDSIWLSFFTYKKSSYRKPLSNFMSKSNEIKNWKTFESITMKYNYFYKQIWGSQIKLEWFIIGSILFSALLFVFIFSCIRQIINYNNSQYNKNKVINSEHQNKFDVPTYNINNDYVLVQRIDDDDKIDNKLIIFDE